MLKNFLMGAMLALPLAGTSRADPFPPTVAVECDPPLTRAAADAYLDILVFMASAVQGVDLGTPPLHVRDQFVSGVAAAYCSGTDEDRAYVASAPERLILLRTLWPELEEARRAELREVWRAQLAPLLPAPQEPRLAAVDSALDVQRQAALVSEMMRIGHETRMTIIDNMSSCPSWDRYCR